MATKTKKENTEVVKTSKPKTLSGVVVSTKMKDTAVVLVQRFIKHPKYQKYMQVRKRFQAHDEGNKAGMGDTVVIEETRPMSRHKTFKIIDIQANPAASE